MMFLEQSFFYSGTLAMPLLAMFGLGLTEIIIIAGFLAVVGVVAIVVVIAAASGGRNRRE